MPIFNVIIPANAAICFNMLMQVAAFDLIPSDVTFNKWFDLEDTGAYSPDFEIMGLESMFCLSNMATVCLCILSVLILLTLNATLLICAVYSYRIYKLNRSISHKFLCRYFLRLVHEIFLIAVLCGVINFYYLRF